MEIAARRSAPAWPVLVSALVHGGVVLALARGPGPVPSVPPVPSPKMVVEVVRDVAPAPATPIPVSPGPPSPPAPARQTTPVPPAKPKPAVKPAVPAGPPVAAAAARPVAVAPSSVPDGVSAPAGSVSADAAPDAAGPPDAAGGSPGSGAGGAPGGGQTGAAPSREAWMAALRARIQDRLVYPDRARKLGLRGRVLVRLHVTGDGDLALDSLVVAASSGADTLDAAALASVRAALPFTPPPLGAIDLELPVAFSVTRAGP